MKAHRRTEGSSHVGLLLFGSLVTLSVILVIMNYLVDDPPARATTPRAPEVVADSCQGAVARVQGYRAPGQVLTLGAQVRDNLASERRPTQAGGWSVERVGSVCLVSLNATIGNAPQTYLWHYRPSSGSVEAQGDATRRLSGW